MDESKVITIVDHRGREFARPKIGFTISSEDRDVHISDRDDKSPASANGSGIWVREWWDWEVIPK
jgi:hypothetical protein